MIPIWSEPTSIRKEFPHTVENCVFCQKPTRTWHENTNNPVCSVCAKSHKVADIPVDHGQLIRRNKRKGLFDREDSFRIK
jgi:hypothetical protein